MPEDYETSDRGNHHLRDEATKQSHVTSDAKGMYDATVTLSNTMIGMSVLTFPYTVYRLGWVISAILLALAFVYSILGFNAIIDAAYFLEARSLKVIVQTITNKRIAMVVDVVMVVHMIGILIVYTSICGDYFHSAIVGFSYEKFQLDIRYVKAAIGVLLIPFMFLRNASKLSSIGVFSTLFIIITVLSTLVYFIIFIVHNKVVYAGTIEGGIVEISPAERITTKAFECPTEGCTMPFANPLLIALPAHKEAWKAFLEIIRRVSIFVALFGCQISIAPLLAELKGSADKRRRVFRRSLFISAVMVLILQTIMAISAAFSFGDKLQSNVLLSFPSVEIYMTVIKLLYACVVFIIFILKMFPIRYVIIGWFKLDKETKKGTITFYILGILIVVIAVLFSIFIPNIDTVFNAISSLFGIVTYWLVPLLLIYKRPQIEAMSTVKFSSQAEEKRKGKHIHTNKHITEEPRDVQIEKAQLISMANKKQENYGPEETSVDQLGVGLLALFGLPIKQARAVTKALKPSNFMQERLLTRQDKHIIRQHEVWRKRACSLPASEAGSEEIESAYQMVLDVLSWEMPEDSVKDETVESSASHAVAIYRMQMAQEEDHNLLSDNKGPSKAIKTIMNMRKRRNSISESKPSADYDLVQDTKPPEHLPIKYQTTSTTVDINDDLLVAGGRETIEIINKEDERRQALKNKMTRTRLALTCCVTALIVVVNLMGFVLSTFVDIETCTWSI